MKFKRLLFWLLLLGTTAARAQVTTLKTVDFETAGSGYTATTIPAVAGNVVRMFDRTNANPAATFNGGTLISGLTGFYWASEQVRRIDMGDPALDVALTSFPVGLNYTNLQIQVSFADARATSTTVYSWEEDDFIKVQYQFDGSGNWITAGQLVGDRAGGFNGLSFTGQLRRDLNMNGRSDDDVSAANPALTNAMRAFTFDVAGAGTTMEVRILYEQTGASEELAMDNIIVRGTASSNQAPVLANIETTALSYAEGAPATIITSTLTVTDGNDANLSSGQVRITTGFDNTEDQLLFINQNGIVGSYNTATGILALTGTASTGNYQAALRSVRYQNTDAINASAATRTVVFSVTDPAGASSAPVSRNITITTALDPIAALPFIETFETDGEGARYASNSFFLSGGTQFLRTQDNPRSTAGNTPTTFSNIAGSWYWFGENAGLIDNPSVVKNGTVTTRQMSAAGRTGVSFGIRLGASSTGTTWQTTDYFKIYYRTGGAGAWTPFASWRGTGTNFSPGVLRQDTNPAAAPGSAAPTGAQLTPALSTLNFPLPALDGQTIEFQLVLVNISSNNDFAFDQIEVTVLSTVTTAAPGSVTGTSAVLGGNVTFDGGGGTTRGVVYSSTSTNPAIGGTGVTQAANGTGAGSFSQTISGLVAGTTYYVRAYATNASGTSYGSVQTFTTPAACTAPTAVAAGSISQTSASVTFTAGTGNTGFTATATPQGGGAAVSNTGTGSPIALTGLAAGTTYTLSLQAVCSAGGTAPAVTTTFTTLACMAPTAVFNNTNASSVCSASGTTLTGTLTGTAPFTGSYTVNGGPAQALSTTGNTFSIATGNLTANATYAITALTNAACTASAFPAPVTVTVNPRPTAALTSTSPGTVCAGTSVTATTTLTGTAPFTVTVATTTASGTTSQTGTVPGSSYPLTNTLTETTTYAITALTDANGCAANVGTLPSITFTVVPLPTFTTAQTNVNCFGGSTGSITVTAAAGTGTFEYSKDGGATYQASNVFNGLAVGSYSVRVRNLGGTQCAAPAQSVSITQPASAVAVTATKTDVTSFGAADGTVTATGNGGTSPFQYSLNGGTTYLPATAMAGPHTFTGLTAGNYTVTVRDANACTATTTITVSSPGAPVCNAPTNLAAGSITQTSASVTFTASTGNTGFTATATPQGGAAVTASGTGSPIALSGLMAGTTYTLNLQAVCAGGGTAPAVTTTFTTQAVCTAPGTPSFTSITTTSASVSFAPSSTNAGPYTVTATAGGSTVTATGAGSPIALTGLASSTTYSVTVTGTCTAAAGGGTSPASAVGSLTTATPAPTCSAATNLAAANVTSNSATVNFTGSGSATSYTVTTNPGTGTQTLPAGATSVNFAGLTAGATYAVSIVSNCAGGLTVTATGSFITSAAPLTNLTVSTPQTISGSYANVTVVGPNGVATLGGTLTVTGTLTVQNGGVLAQNCQPLTGPGSFVLQAGSELRICDANGIASTGATGAVQLTGSRSFSPGADYAYNGTAAQVTGPGLPSEVRNLTLNNSTGLTLTNALAVAQVVRLTSGDLALNSRDLTLLSSSDGTALVDNAGGVVNGTATVQRYIDPTLNAGRGYRHYSAPVANTTFDDLQTATFTPMVNAQYNLIGNTVTPFPTVFGYDQSRVNTSGSAGSLDFDKGFFSPTLTSDAMQRGRGYAVNIPASELVDFRGTLNNGNISTGPLARGTQAESGWQFLGNPYPSPLDWSTVSVPVGLNSAVYVFQSTSQYTGTYRSYQNGMGAGNPLIASSQGFFVRVAATVATPTLALTNANRVTVFTGPNPTFNRGNDPRPQVQLTLNGANSAAVLADPAYVYFEQGATAGVDERYDAYKLRNSGTANLYALSGTEELSIAGFAPLTALDVVVPLGVSVPTAGTYVLHTAELRNFARGTDVYLRDAQTGLLQHLGQAPSYSFAVAAGQLTNTTRFALVFRPGAVSGTRADLQAAQVDVYPNPAHRVFTLNIPAVPTARTVQAVLYNALGQSVLARTVPVTATGVQAQFDVANLATGVYLLRVTAGNAQVTKRVVVE